MRRRRGRRLLIVRLLLLRRLFCGLLRCCFLRCHVISTSLRCQNFEQCMSGISEFVDRVHFSLLDISVGRERVPETLSYYGELEDRPLRASLGGDARCARQAERKRRATRGLNSILDRHPHSARRLVCSPLCAWNDHCFIMREGREHRRPTGYACARFHLMLQPMLALCLLSTGFPVSAA